MKHMDDAEALVESVLRTTRTVAIVGASPRPQRHSREVVAYLHKAGYDVIPVRPDRAPVEGRPSAARLDEIPGQVDLVVIFRQPDSVPAHIIEAADAGAHAVWLPPGAWSHAAEQEARDHDLALIKERCPIEEHQHIMGALGEPGAGHPLKQRIHFSRHRS